MVTAITHTIVLRSARLRDLFVGDHGARPAGARMVPPTADRMGAGAGRSW
jgi:hypothetical protein